MSEDPGYLLSTVQTAIGWDVAGLATALEAMADKTLAVREQIAPLRSELKMLQEKYASKGRSPSHSDIIRSTLMAKLKEEERTKYNACPDTRVDSKGNQLKVELTDGRCEDLAHAREEYQEFVRKTNRDHRRIGHLGKELAPLYDRLEFLRGKKQALLERLEIARALIYSFNATSRI